VAKLCPASNAIAVGAPVQRCADDIPSEARKLVSSLPARPVSRRSFLKASAAGAGAAVALKTGLLSSTPRAHAAPASGPLERHRSWVWQYPDDGAPNQIRDTLAYTGMAVILKTHDGSEFMRRWSDAPPAIASPEEVRTHAAFFEERGVPFHAWCVVEGLDPIREARICSDVLQNGARSLTLDLEPKEDKNYWQAGKEEARAFGNELRRLRPDAYIIVAPDPRPWQLDAVPMAQFAAIANEIAPQTYWNTFHTEGVRDLYAARGRFVDRADMGPEWFLDQVKRDLQEYNLPIRPVGQGAAPAERWRRFISHAGRLGMHSTSVWRHGIATPGVFDAFRDARPPEPVAPPPPPPAPRPAPASPQPVPAAPPSSAWQRLARTWQQAAR
jgi:hypothetical protein